MNAPTLSRVRPRLSVVIPTYREAENLAALFARLMETLNGAGIACEIIVVDDDSGDGTEEIIADAVRRDVPLRLIVRRGERGLSSAVLRGFHEAAGDVLLCMDADLSHPPEAIPQLLAALADPQVDFVIGSRYVTGGSTEQGWGGWRRLNSKAATLLARPLTTAKDPLAGFFALPRSVFERAEGLNPIGYKIGLELMVKCRCRQVREVPIHFADRHRGASKLTIRQQWQYLRHVLRLVWFKLRRRG